MNSACLGAVIFLFLPMLDDIPGKEFIRRNAMGLGVGAIVGAITWPIRQRFRRKEREAIEQMHAEVQSEGEPSD
jgi:hypothetical protein